MLNLDCAHYLGDKPCIHDRLCEGCPLYKPCGADPRSPRILVIKTAALGDVMRTTSILKPLRKKFPGARIAWLTSERAAPLLIGNPEMINEIITLDSAARGSLFPREFDLILSLDKSTAECAIATALKAKEKRGMGLSGWGTVFPLNPEAEYYFSLGLSDELKFRQNTKTYLEMIFEVCGLEGAPEPAGMFISDREREEARQRVIAASGRPAGPAVGFVVGAGGAFANKAPSPEKWAEIIGAVRRDIGESASLLILGGPDDNVKMDAVAGLVEGIAAVVPPISDVRIYAGVIGRMSAIVCGDTLALHIAAAMGGRAVALFGPTCHREIDMFGEGVKIVTNAACAPCYKSECGVAPNCMDAIRAEDIARAVAGLTGGISD